MQRKEGKSGGGLRQVVGLEQTADRCKTRGTRGWPEPAHPAKTWGQGAGASDGSTAGAGIEPGIAAPAPAPLLPTKAPDQIPPVGIAVDVIDRMKPRHQ